MIPVKLLCKNYLRPYLARKYLLSPYYVPGVPPGMKDKNELGIASVLKDFMTWGADRSVLGGHIEQ